MKNGSHFSAAPDREEPNPPQPRGGPAPAPGIPAITRSALKTVKGTRMSQPSRTQNGYRNTLWWRIYDEAAQAADRAVGWDKLPRVLGLLVLVGLRNILRQRNLYDTSALPSNVHPKVPDPGPETLTTRTPDGSCNDLGQPAMGMAGTRFGRNLPLRWGYQEGPDRILDPNPPEVTRALPTRHHFLPALSPAFVPGWWLGLNMMSTVFIREHNAVADALKAAYPQWTDEDLYQRARLVIAALIAKIHTVEWTPAIIAHPTTITGMSANWWGLAGERIHQPFGRIGSSGMGSG